MKKGHHLFGNMSKRSYSNYTRGSTTSFATRKKTVTPTNLFGGKKRSKSYAKGTRNKMSRGLNKSALTKLIDSRITAKKELKYGYKSMTLQNLTSVVTGAALPVYMDISASDIDQGLDINDRIGNDIELQRVMLKFEMQAVAAAAVQYVQVFVGRFKGNPQSLLAIGNYNEMLLAPDGTMTGLWTLDGVVPEGYTRSMYAWNTPMFDVVYSEKFILHDSYDEEGSVAHASRSVDLTKYWKKKLRFDGAAVGPQDNMFVCFFPFLDRASGTNPTAQANVVFEFVDA